MATISSDEGRTCFEQEKLTTVISTPGLTSFTNDENCFIFLFFESPIKLPENCKIEINNTRTETFWVKIGVNQLKLVRFVENRETNGCSKGIGTQPK